MSQELAIEFLSRVVNKNLLENSWTEPFTENELGIQWFAKPLQDIKQLKLSFPFIDGEGFIEIQPATYISHLLGHKGSGSIILYLASKGWANTTEAWYSPICRGSNGTFEVKIDLTDKVSIPSFYRVIEILNLR